jgi:hypothetical protein
MGWPPRFDALRHRGRGHGAVVDAELKRDVRLAPEAITAGLRRLVVRPIGVRDRMVAAVAVAPVGGTVPPGGYPGERQKQERGLHRQMAVE